MIETRTARVSLHEDWCVITEVREECVQTVTDARDNLDAAVKMCGSTRRPLLVDITRARPLEPEVRHFYTGEQLVEAFHALGLVVEASPFGKVMGNIYFRIARPGIATKLFTSRDAAFEWLRGFAR
jgi:hypothetical protein